MIRAITEWDLRICGLEKVGQRAMDVARVFSGRYVESMKRNHYHIMGWDVDSGIPTRARLEDMGIGWVAEQLGWCGVSTQWAHHGWARRLLNGRHTA